MLSPLCLIVGALGLLCLGLGVLAAGVAWLHDTVVRRAEELGQARGIEHERSRMAADAWWFSEDAVTCEAMRGLAQGQDVNRVRETWRQARTRIAPPQPKGATP